jgi:hypothetical protein
VKKIAGVRSVFAMKGFLMGVFELLFDIFEIGAFHLSRFHRRSFILLEIWLM